MKKILLPLAALLILLSACGPKIYKSNEFDDVTSKHKIVAILPAEVSISLRPNTTKKMTVEEMEKNRQATGYAIQDKMYSWFLRRSDKFKYTVKFQDVSKTNSLLKEAGITYADLLDKSKENLAKLLGVDAVINPSWKQKQSEGIDFIGVGNEPFWSLEIDNEKMISFKLADWKKPVVVASQKPTITKDSTLYMLSSQGMPLRVIIYPQFCSDGMSDFLYQYKVAVSFKGSTYKGCGVMFGNFVEVK